MDAILLSAGVGHRTGLGYPKQFLLLNGKPMIVYSLEILRSCEKIQNIIVACNKETIDLCREFIEKYHISGVECVLGGETRQDSVRIGLKRVKSSRVLIHESARPLISLDFIKELLAVENEVAVVPTIPIKFTVLEGGEYMEKELIRKKLHNVQLPQIFDSCVLKEAHEKAVIDGYQSTEDGMLVFHYGNKVRFVPGRESNIKVTTMLDVEMVNKLLKLS